MGGGGSKQQAPPPPAKREVKLDPVEEAQLAVKIQRDRMTKLVKRMDFEIEVANKRAREAVLAGDKGAALRWLKLGKAKELQRGQVHGQLGNLDVVVMTLESQRSTVQVMEALKKGDAALQKLQKDLPIEKIEEIMDNLEDGVAYVDELADAVSRDLGEASSAALALRGPQLDDEVAALEAEMLAQGASGKQPVAAAHASATAAIGGQHVSAAANSSASIAAPAAAAEEPFVLPADMPEIPTGPIIAPAVHAERQHVAIPS